MSLKIVVIYGSVRKQRQGIKAARFVINKLQERGHSVTFVDPLEYDLPLLDKMYKEYPEGQAPEALEKLAGIYREADAFVFVCGEYNQSVPPALSNLIAYFMNEYFWKPAGIVSYSAGPFGGVRAAIHLRVILGEVGLVTLPSVFPVSGVQDSFDETGKALEKSYDRRIQKFLQELEWYGSALGRERKNGVPY